MLHITNGDVAAEGIRRAGVPGVVLPWRDVLHEGPVPAGLSLDELRPVRARFIAGCGWAEFADALRGFAERDAALAGFRAHDEVVLWFEHDLYDQLQLVQLLDHFARYAHGGTRLTGVWVGEYLGRCTPERMRAWFDARPAVSSAQVELGRRAWEAFRAPDPGAVLGLLREDTSALPFLAGALLRHLEQFPSARNGLSRSETQALEAIREGAGTVRDAFTASQAREEALFLGDSTFVLYLEELSNRHQPLVVREDGGRVLGAREAGYPEVLDQRVRVTPTGEAVLEGRADRIALNGIDRWLGGVHLHGGPAWRWDGAARDLRWV